MRIFVAFSVSEDAKNEMLRLQAELGALNRCATIKWMEKRNMHITLEFLGEIDSLNIEKTKDVLSRVTPKARPPKFVLGEIDGFPNLSRPNAVVVDINDLGGGGVKIYNDAHKLFVATGLIKEIGRPWQPHATLCRVKAGPFTSCGIEKIKVNHIYWVVNEINLMTSEPSSEGSKYKILEKYKLEG